MQTGEIQKLIAARRPGWCLDQPFYADESILQADLERVFRRYWLFVGHACQIPHPGDYFTYTLGRDPLLILRDDDGQIQALFNVCRHRGSLLCEPGSGHVKKLVCPYHQWVYEKNGALAHARLMPEDFDTTPFNLHHAAVRVEEGMIFVCLADDPPDFDPAAESFRSHLRPYALERAKVALRETITVHCNWKLITENFRECYHCAGGHPEYCRAVIGTTLVEPGEKVRAVWEDRLAHWKGLGLATETTPFTNDTWYHATRYPFRPGFVSESLDGKPVAPLLGELTDPDAGVFAIVTYPNFWLEASSDYCWTMRITPLSATQTEAELTWLVREDAVEGVDYDLERLTAFWKATAHQDYKLCEDNQAGILSTRYRPGPYAPSESDIEKFLVWYLRQLTS